MTARYVVYGTGGVGKTTTAAALAVALARGGARTLVVTTDPARRLADVLGVPATATLEPVPSCPGLMCFMPEAQVSMRAVIDELLLGEPTLVAALRDNPVYAMLASGLAGMHELVTLASVAPLLARFDAVVIDTAPARHALDMVALPARLRALLDSRALTWLGHLADGARGPSRGLGQRLLDWGQARIVAQFEHAVGGRTVTDTLDVLRAIMLARPRLVTIADAAATLLTSATTTHVVVVTPRVGADGEARWFADGLTRVARPPSVYVVNRTVAALPPWISDLATDVTLAAPLRVAVDLAHREASTAIAATTQIMKALAVQAPTATVIVVPAMPPAAPIAIVDAMAPLLARALNHPLQPRLNDPQEQHAWTR